MSVDMQIAAFELKYQGVFDLDKFYKRVQEWYAGHGFRFQENIHKFKPPELELEWSGWRKDTGYRKTIIEMKYHGWEHKEVMVNGKKMVSSRVRIALIGKMILDYEDRYEKNAFFRTLRNFLHKFIFYYKINITWSDMVYYELEDLQTNIREFMDTTMKGGAPWP